MTVCECWSGRDSGERTQQEALARPDWREFAGTFGWPDGGRLPPPPSGREWEGAHRARARSNWASQGQRCGRCSVRRRAERVIRPAREKNRRGGSWWSPPARPDRCALSSGRCCGPSPVPPARRRWRRSGPRGDGSPHTVLEVSDGILDLGVAAMVGLQFEHLPVPVGDEAVIAVGGEEGQLGTGRGLQTPDDEPHRRGVRFTLEGSAGGLGHIGGAVHPVGNGSPGILGYRLDEIAQALVLADGD